MLRLFISANIILLFCAQTNAQIEAYQDNYQKGYLKDSVKVKFWDYYNSEGELEFKYNHSSNRIIYLKPDTSRYSIYEQGKWVKKRLDVYPRIIGSMNDFYTTIASSLTYPNKARKNLTQGTLYLSFEIDTLGKPINYSIHNDIGNGCGDMVINSVRSISGSWIPAIKDGQKYQSKFILPVLFELEGEEYAEKKVIKPIHGMLLSEIKIVGYGDSGSSNNSFQIDTDSPSLGFFEHSSLRSALAVKDIARMLYLRSSNIKELSNKIGFLTNLRLLDLGENQLNILPEKIRNLKLLRELYLDNNNLSIMPAGITKLSSLEVLSIAANNFSVMPNEIFELKNLKALDLSNNTIKFIPPSISNLKKLELLSLEYCGLTSLPVEINELTGLKEINLKGNKIEPSIIEKLKLVLPDLKITN